MNRKQHMARRKSQGVTYRELAGEFGTSKSSAHRALTQGGVPGTMTQASNQRRGQVARLEEDREGLNSILSRGYRRIKEKD
jgi:transposase